VGAVNLFKVINWEEVQKRTPQMRIKWKFNPPAAPWWGGWWERLIRSVKDLLKRMLGFQKLSYVELETCLCQVESVVNNRPLTFVTEDPDDLIPLTPAMFIHALPDGDVPEAEILKVASLGARKKNLDKLFDELKNPFRTEYLGLLVQRGKDPKFREFKIGEIILVEKENKKRIFLPMAKILELIPGKDGIVRVARLKFKKGEILRPIQRLFPLEVPLDEAHPIVKQGLKEKPKRDEPHQPKEIKTRSGRLSHAPLRFCDY